MNLCRKRLAHNGPALAVRKCVRFAMTHTRGTNLGDTSRLHEGQRVGTFLRWDQLRRGGMLRVHSEFSAGSCLL